MSMITLGLSLLEKGIKRLSTERGKTKAKVITLANHKGNRKSSEPIKIRSNYTVHLADAKREKTCVSASRLLTQLYCVNLF